jgi:hypothetical protein
MADKSIHKLRLKSCARLIPKVAAHLGMPVPLDLENIDAYLPFLNQMRAEGCYVLLKIDGPRPGASQYTGVASGGPLGETTLHTDTRSLAMAAAFLVAGYARACWGIVDD